MYRCGESSSTLDPLPWLGEWYKYVMIDKTARNFIIKIYICWNMLNIMDLKISLIWCRKLDTFFLHAM